MRKVEENEWEQDMGNAVKQGDLEKIRFLWSMYAELKVNGYFEIPF